VAVASNSPEPIVRAALLRAGLADAFDAVVPVEAVGRPKPAPDLYLTACRRLGTSPGRTVAFEDSLTGLASARGAGLVVVGVPSLAGDYPADWVLGSLAEPAVGEWIAGW
jgi:HAD superfamily hydrolase (TIGR01509 family)